MPVGYIIIIIIIISSGIVLYERIYTFPDTLMLILCLIFARNMKTLKYLYN